MAKIYSKKPTSKEELRQLIRLWPTSTSQQIADRLGRNLSWVHRFARSLRTEGADLPKKVRGAYLNDLIREVVAETTRK